ncbi:Hypothetical protein A7982_08574 [Minicystis rosea]|nr:Hypothetical protein A7982_08574 [Minicystis rosea]
MQSIPGDPRAAARFHLSERLPEAPARSVAAGRVRSSSVFEHGRAGLPPSRGGGSGSTWLRARGMPDPSAGRGYALRRGASQACSTGQRRKVTSSPRRGGAAERTPSSPYTSVPRDLPVRSLSDGDQNAGISRAAPHLASIGVCENRAGRRRDGRARNPDRRCRRRPGDPQGKDTRGFQAAQSGVGRGA